MSNKNPRKSEAANRNAIDWTKIDLHDLGSLPLSMFTLKEVATLLKVEPTFITGLIDEGALSAIDISSPPHSRKHYRISKQAFIAYLRRKGIQQKS
jgi:excisionase family DNA binding protein